MLCDDGDGLAERAADVLGGAGYANLFGPGGRCRGLGRAGFELFTGVNVPSKAFGELVEHRAPRRISPPTSSKRAHAGEE